MRPVYLRPRIARRDRADFAAERLRTIDLLALVLGYGLLLSMCVAGLISLFDWLDGRPQTVLPQIAALIARMD